MTPIFTDETRNPHYLCPSVQSLALIACPEIVTVHLVKKIQNLETLKLYSRTSKETLIWKNRVVTLLNKLPLPEPVL